MKMKRFTIEIQKLTWAAQCVWQAPELPKVYVNFAKAWKRFLRFFKVEDFNQLPTDIQRNFLKGVDSTESIFKMMEQSAPPSPPPPGMTA